MNAPNVTSLSKADTTPLNTLLRHVIPFVPRVPHAMALDLLRQKYIDFSRRTRILCCKVITDYQAGVYDYQLEAPDGYEVYTVLGIPRMGWNGSIIWDKRFDVVDNNRIYLHSAPSSDYRNGLQVYVTLLPTECVDYIPTSISIPFGQKIARGVVGDLLFLPNKDWTNAGLGRKYELDYERMILSARALAVSNRKVDSNLIKPVRIL